MTDERESIAEHIERESMTSLFDLASKATQQDLGLASRSLDGALAFAAKGCDSLFFNRAMGLAQARPGATASSSAELVLQQFRASIEFFAQRGIARYLVHLPASACSDTLEQGFAQLGLERFHRSWDEFIRNPNPPAQITTDLELAQAEARDADAITRLLSEGFAIPNDGGRVYAEVIGKPHWHNFVARANGKTVAFGSLFEKDGLGYLAAAATHPDYRRRGAQGALMTARMQRAVDCGCRWVATVTGQAVPGEDNPSYQNMLRSGFEVVGTRHNYCPRGLTWTGFRQED